MIQYIFQHALELVLIQLNIIGFETKLKDVLNVTYETKIWELQNY